MTTAKAKPISAAVTAFAFAATTLIAAPGVAMAESSRNNHKNYGYSGGHNSRPQHGSYNGGHRSGSHHDSYRGSQHRPWYRPAPHYSYNDAQRRPWSGGHGYRPPAHRPTPRCYSRSHGHAYGQPHGDYRYRTSSHHNHVGEVIGAFALTAAAVAILTH